MTNVIVWDIETIPDLRGYAAANGLVGKTDDEIRTAMGDKFPKHIYHSSVCIGCPGGPPRQRRSLDHRCPGRPACWRPPREGIDCRVR
jgi:hypothetical protein